VDLTPIKDLQTTPQENTWFRNSGLAPTSIMQISGHKNMRCQEKNTGNAPKSFCSQSNHFQILASKIKKKQCELKNVNLPLSLSHLKRVMKHAQLLPTSRSKITA